MLGIHNRPKASQPLQLAALGDRKLFGVDLGLALLCGLTLILITVGWMLQEGYNQADSVEYVDRASNWAERGHLTGSPKTQRCAAMSLVFVPLFVLAKALGVADVRFIWLLARALQVGISLGFVLASARLGARLASYTWQSKGEPRNVGARDFSRQARLAGLVAGFLVVCNPVFLRFSSDPLAGLTAGALVALGTSQLLTPRSEPFRVRDNLLGGLYLGLAAIVSYKVLPLAAVLWALCTLRDGWRESRRGLLRLAGLACGLGIGVVIDYIAYGSWGLSLANYLAYNLAVTAVPLLLAIGLRETATWLFGQANHYYDFSTEVDTEKLVDHIATHPPKTWYLANLDEFLAVPVLLCLLLTIVVSLRRPRWPTSILIVSVLAFGVVLSAKHSKSYRLFLPALPLIAALGGLGWLQLWGASAGRELSARRALALALLGLALTLGLTGFWRLGPRLHGHFWQAIAWVEAERVREGRPSVRFASSHPFATLFRTGPELQSVALRQPLQVLVRDGEQSPHHLAAHVQDLNKLDWLLVTEQTLRGSRHLRERVSERFVVAAAFFEPHNEQAWGPVFVLRRSPRTEGGRRFFALHEQPASPAADTEVGLREFGLADPDGEQLSVRLDSLSYEVLPGSGMGWVSSVWQVDQPVAGDLRLQVRLDGSKKFEKFRFEPGQGQYPAATWQPGVRITEASHTSLDLDEFENGVRVVASVSAFDPSGRRLGTLVPRVHAQYGPPEARGGWTRVAQIASAPSSQDSAGPPEFEVTVPPTVVASGHEQSVWQALAWIESARVREGGERATFSASQLLGPLSELTGELEYVPLAVPLQAIARIGEVPSDYFEQHVNELETVDWLIVNDNTLHAASGLRGRLNERFTLEAAFFDETQLHDPWGPILVLRRRAPGSAGRRFFSWERVEDSSGDEAATVLREFSFVASGGARQAIRLAGFQYEELPGSGLGWITSCWEIEQALDVDLLLRLAFETPDHTDIGQFQMQPGYNLHPTSTWAPNTRFTDGRLVSITNEDLDAVGGWGRVWLSILASDTTGRRLGNLEPVLDPRLRLPVRQESWTQVARILSARQ